MLFQFIRRTGNSKIRKIKSFSNKIALRMMSISAINVPVDIVTSGMVVEVNNFSRSHYLSVRTSQDHCKVMKSKINVLACHAVHYINLLLHFAGTEHG